LLINNPDREHHEEGNVVRAKKQTRRAGSINYLLSLDRTLRRASVRKLVDRVKPKRRTAAKAASKSMKASAKRTSRSQQRQSSLAPRNVVVGTLCVVAAAAIVMGRPSTRAWVTHLDEKGQVTSVEPLVSADQIAEPAVEKPAPRVATQPVSTAPAPAPALTTKPVRPLPSEPARLPNAVYASEPTPTMTAASARTTETVSARSSENNPENAAATTKEGSTVAASAPEPVTITGCLERNDDTFLLKNASGDGAPKSRSWKSGFLRKKSNTVAVTGPYTTRLASYVGRQVETTGLLVDREMQAKSVRVLGSCE
jgi:hypothetical protein